MPLNESDLEAFGYYDDPLSDMIRAVEEGTLDQDVIRNALSKDDKIPAHSLFVVPAYDGSVDAALEFLKSVLPLHTAGMQTNGMTFVTKNIGTFESAFIGGNIGRSLLLSTLKALRRENNSSDNYRM